MFARLRNASSARGARPSRTAHPGGSATRLSPRRAGQAGEAFSRVAPAKSHAGAQVALLADRVGSLTPALKGLLVQLVDNDIPVVVGIGLGRWKDDPLSAVARPNCRGWRRRLGR